MCKLNTYLLITSKASSSVMQHCGYLLFLLSTQLISRSPAAGHTLKKTKNCTNHVRAFTRLDDSLLYHQWSSHDRFPNSGLLQRWRSDHGHPGSDLGPCGDHLQDNDMCMSPTQHHFTQLEFYQNALLNRRMEHQQVSVWPNGCRSGRAESMRPPISKE